MSNPDRKNLVAESTLAMMAEMQRINDELHHLGEETLSRVNALLRAETPNRPHPEEDEAPERRRSA